MAELGRVCGSQADLFRAILARISHLNKLPLQQVAAQMTYQASCRHERIFRRPKREDRRSAQARDGQEPSRPHLLCLAVLRQTLCQTRRGGSLASPQEETRLKTQDRRASQKAA